MNNWTFYTLWLLIWVLGVWTGWFAAKAMVARRETRGYDLLLSMLHQGRMPDADDALWAFGHKRGPRGVDR